MGERAEYRRDLPDPCDLSQLADNEYVIADKRAGVWRVFEALPTDAELPTVADVRGILAPLPVDQGDPS